MGYEVSSFLQAPDAEFICSICQDVLQEPVQTPCEHFYCEECILGVLKRQKQCPICRVPVEAMSLKPMFRSMRNVLNNQQIRCANRDRGCTAILKLGSYHEHLAECTYAPVPCTNGNCPNGEKPKYLNRGDLQGHLKVCDWRIVACPNGCPRSIAFADKFKHDMECVKKKIPCEQKCGAFITRSDIENHVSRECAKTSVPCPISTCSYKAERGDSAAWETHMVKSQTFHFDAMISLVTDQRNRLTACEQLVASQAETIRLHESRIRDLESLSDKVVSVEPFEGMSRTVSWTLDSFDDLFKQSIGIYSPEIKFDCVERKHRYTFMLKLEFNANSHVGVMLVPRPGEEPSLLEWPIRNIVSITVVSVTDKKPITVICDDPSFFDFFKEHSPPAKDNLAAWGFPKFLKEKAIRSGDYIHDNKVKFELHLSK